jgi:hypothetical protein
VTGPTVTMKYFQHPKMLFRDWAKKNYVAISREFVDVKKHDLWVITKVYLTPRCAISTWDGGASSSSLYATVGALSGSALTLGGEVGQEQSNALWRFLPDDQGDSDGLWKCIKGSILGKDDGKQVSSLILPSIADNCLTGFQTPPYVVFIGGLRYRRFFGKVVGLLLLRHRSVIIIPARRAS